MEATSTPRVRDKIKNWYIYEEPDADFEIKNSTSTIANGHKAVYNEIYEAGVDSVGMSASIAKKLRANPSCSLLNIYYQKKNNDSLFWLPHEFFNTKLCGVVKNGDNVIFYAIGKYKGYETSWYLMPGILILTPDAMIVAENLVPNMDIYLGNWDNEYSKNHKNLDFGSKEWFSYDKSKGEKIDSLLNNPTKEMKDYFIKLKGIANSVVMD